MEGRSQHHQLIDENKGFQYFFVNSVAMLLILLVMFLPLPIVTITQSL